MSMLDEGLEILESLTKILERRPDLKAEAKMGWTAHLLILRHLSGIRANAPPPALINMMMVAATHDLWGFHGLVAFLT